MRQFQHAFSASLTLLFGPLLWLEAALKCGYAVEDFLVVVWALEKAMKGARSLGGKGSARRWHLQEYHVPSFEPHYADGSKPNRAPSLSCPIILKRHYLP